LCMLSLPIASLPGTSAESTDTASECPSGHRVSTLIASGGQPFAGQRHTRERRPNRSPGAVGHSADIRSPPPADREVVRRLLHHRPVQPKLRCSPERFNAPAQPTCQSSEPSPAPASSPSHCSISSRRTGRTVDECVNVDVVGSQPLEADLARGDHRTPGSPAGIESSASAIELGG